MATVKFPSEMPSAADVGGNDKLMISKDGSGEAFQVSFNDVKQYLEITDIELDPVQGGSSSGRATVIPIGPSGQNRKMDASPGWYSVGGVPVEATAGHVWKWFWNGSSWSLVDMGELPEYDINDDLGTTSRAIEIDVSGYIENGGTLENGTNDGNSSRRSVVDMPVSTYIGKLLNIEGLQNGSKNVVYRTSSNTVVRVDAAVSFPYSDPIPAGADKVSFTIKYNTTDTYDNLLVKVTDIVEVERVVSIKQKEIEAKGLSDGNYVPTPISPSNAVPLGYFQDNAVLKSQIGVIDFQFSPNVDVFRDKYVNQVGFVHDEEGSVYVEIPYVTGENIAYEGVVAVDGVDVTNEYLFDRVFLNAEGVRTGNVLVTGASITDQPFIFTSSIATLVKLRINIFRKQQEGKFDFGGLKIYNQTTGEVYVTSRNLVNSIEGRELLPSQIYQDEINTRLTNLDNAIGRLGVKNIGRNVYIRRNNNNNRRFDHCMVRRTTDGNLICVHSYFYDDAADLAPSSLAVSRSTDNGNSWALFNIKPFTTAYSDVIAESNPDVVQKDNGDFVVFHSVKTVSNGSDRALAYSILSNDGSTWSETTFITGFDRTAPGGGGGWKMRTGEILVPIYRLVSGETSADAVSVGGLLKSTDGGETFVNTGLELYDTDNSTTASVSVFEPYIYETTSNVLIYGYRTLKGYSRARKSSNAGGTWGNSFNLFKAANSMSNVKRLSFYDNKINFIYMAVHNRIDGSITGHATDRRYMHVSVSIDGENFYNGGEMIYSYNGSKLAFEPNIFEDMVSDNIYVAWSDDGGGVSALVNIISKDGVLRMVDRLTS